ncbi:hypothetical protein BGX38DRAFT_333921 [Terfezia claveryi]|nr:hypothetical protein BGX38DRAFT_333921 [Terfezia claveryi]
MNNYKGFWGRSCHLWLLYASGQQSKCDSVSGGADQETSRRLRTRSSLPTHSESKRKSNTDAPLPEVIDSSRYIHPRIGQDILVIYCNLIAVCVAP